MVAAAARNFEQDIPTDGLITPSDQIAEWQPHLPRADARHLAASRLFVHLDAETAERSKVDVRRHTQQLGCAILSLTDNQFGVVSGILFLGAGFAPVYPLVVEQIGDRFPYYDPVFYHGIFSLAFTGALLAPAGLGYLSHYAGVKWVMIAPLVGSAAVFFLLLILMIENRLARQGPRTSVPE